MHLVLTDELTKEIVRLSRTDTRLLHTLAREWVRKIPTERLYSYLLQGNAAAELLAQRLKDNPAGTLRDLEKLAAGKKSTTAAVAKESKRAVSKPKTGGRLRLSTDQVAKLKDDVVAFLQNNGWATRKQISEAASIPTPSLYNRIIAELREEKKLVMQGEKARRVYALATKAAGANKSTRKKTSKGKKATKASKRKTKAKRRSRK